MTTENAIEKRDLEEHEVREHLNVLDRDPSDNRDVQPMRLSGGSP